MALALLLGGCHPAGQTIAQGPAGTATPADIAGTWLPDASQAGSWPDPLPLTPAARGVMEHFTPSDDPTSFCMPLGTPRNMLQTEYPLEIVQTAQSVFMILQPNLANTEVRRIALGGALPATPDASWYGTSRGRWDGSTLVVETIGLRPDAPIDGSGLAHSAELRVTERLSLLEDKEHGRVLEDEIELHDPKAYQADLKTRRYFDWAPHAQSREGSCIELRWIDKLWRDRLREHAAAAHKGTKSE